MKWDDLESGKLYALGFLVVDVCRSSSRVPAEKGEIYEFLKKLVMNEAEQYGGKLLRWDGDGGFCGFLQECEPMVKAAESILIELNPARFKQHLTDFSIRICLHFGSVIWNKDYGKIAGDELSWICKMEKEIGIPDAIVITHEVYGFLEDHGLKGKFKRHAAFQQDRNRQSIDTYIYDPISIPRLIEIAEKYYEKGKLLENIDREYELSDQQIKALLETADIKGIVKKSVDRSAIRAIELEENIKEKFKHLKRVRVINYRGPDIKQEIGKFAAYEVRNLGIKPGSSIAISCGTTVMELAKNLEANPAGIENVNIYPLVITMSAEMEESSPAGIISFLTRILPKSKGYAVQFPKIETDSFKANSRKEVYAVDCESLLEGAKNARYMFTGIGSIGKEGVTYSFNALIKSLELLNIIKNNLKAVGESCHQPFTISGEFLIGKNKLNLLRANLIYVELKELQKKVIEGEDVLIFALAGGKEKHESILGGLRAKIFNCLITDIETAEYIVEHG